MLTKAYKLQENNVNRRALSFSNAELSAHNKHDTCSVNKVKLNNTREE